MLENNQGRGQYGASARPRLHSTLDGAKALSILLEEVKDEVVEQLALQSEQQRAIDAAERDLSRGYGELEDMATYSAEVLQPLVDEAAEANRELPLLQLAFPQARKCRSTTSMARNRR